MNSLYSAPMVSLSGYVRVNGAFEMVHVTHYPQHSGRPTAEDFAVAEKLWLVTALEFVLSHQGKL